MNRFNLKKINLKTLVLPFLALSLVLVSVVFFSRGDAFAYSNGLVDAYLWKSGGNAIQNTTLADPPGGSMAAGFSAVDSYGLPWHVNTYDSLTAQSTTLISQTGVWATDITNDDQAVVEGYIKIPTGLNAVTLVDNSTSNDTTTLYAGSSPISPNILWKDFYDVGGSSSSISGILSVDSSYKKDCQGNTIAWFRLYLQDEQANYQGVVRWDIGAGVVDIPAANFSDGNACPIPIPDTNTTTVANPVTTSVLSNDTDPDGNTLTLSSATPPVITSGDTAGIVIANPDGTITYTPSANFTGTTVITYTVDDGKGGAATTTATITVTSVPTISPSSTTIPTTTASGSTIVPGSSLMASDPDGDTLTYSITAGNANSYFAIDPSTGNITTTQTNIPAGTYTLTVQVDDGNGGTATADVTITVTASTTTALYCPAPYDTTMLLTPSGDCDGDGITNQAEGYDPDGDGNPSTGTAPIDTDGDGIPDYLDLDTDNDGILDAEEKGTTTDSSTNPIDTDGDGIPDFRDIDSNNNGITDLLESGRGYPDTNNDGKIDSAFNNYGIADVAALATDPKALTVTSLADNNGNGIPDYCETNKTATKMNLLASTGQSLKALTIASILALGLAGYTKLKNSKGTNSYKRR